MNGTRLYSWHRLTICKLWITASQLCTSTLRFPKPRRSLKSTNYWHLSVLKRHTLTRKLATLFPNGFYAASDLSRTCNLNLPRRAVARKASSPTSHCVISTFKDRRVQWLHFKVIKNTLLHGDWIENTLSWGRKGLVNLLHSCCEKLCSCLLFSMTIWTIKYLLILSHLGRTLHAFLIFCRTVQTETVKNLNLQVPSGTTS